MKYSYAVLCFLGAVVPYYFLITWLMQHGLNIELLWSEIINSRIAAFAWTDVLVSAVALILFIQVEARRIDMKYSWLPIVATCSVGVSLGLPLFLLMRELHMARQKSGLVHH